VSRTCTRLSVLALTTVLAACAGSMGGGQEQDYAHRTGDNTVIVSWNCMKAEPNLLAVKGIINDTIGASIQDVTIEIIGIGPDGAQVSSGKGSPKEMVVTTMDRAPWQVLVNRAGTERQYDLYYSYRVGRGLTYASQQKNAQMNACPNLQ